MKRRKFIQGTAALSALTLIRPSVAFGSKANSAIRMGIIGCGGRGIGVISSMSTQTNIHIIAMADLFEDKLDHSKKILDEQNFRKGFPPISNTYLGSKSYLKLLENKDIDAVLISSPAYTHPEFLEAAALAGKHIYCEKPASPDVAGCLKVEQVGKMVNGKQSIVLGFQIRYATPYVEMVKRIHRGDIGEILSVNLSYQSSKLPITEITGLSDAEARIRNQYHFNALSGGILCDQSIHILDVCNWALQKLPISAIGKGGIDKTQKIGDSWKHFQVIYQYPGINVSLSSSQFGPYFGDVCARFVGTKGTAEAHYSGGVYISGDSPWDSGVVRCAATEPTDEQRRSGVFLSSLFDADVNKQIAFIRSIETGNFLNETKSGAESALTAILGRDAAISGKKIEWGKHLRSKARLEPMLNLSQFDK